MATTTKKTAAKKAAPKTGDDLTSYVHVQDDDHPMTVFGPDDDLPDWARAAITNDKAFAVPEDEE